MKSAFLAIAALLLMSRFIGCRREAAAPPAAVELRIAAAASLRELLVATDPVFAAAHGGLEITVSFEASSTLSRQIEAAAGYDCFLSADATCVDRLGDRIAAATRTEFLRNELVVVARKGLTPRPSDAASLASLPGRLALAAEAVPAGRYACAWLKKCGRFELLQRRIVSCDDVRAALALVESGAADAAVVYATDARVAKSAQVAFRVPPAENPGVVYVAATVAGAKSPLAAEYVAWLRSSEFQGAAVRLGFESIAP